MIAFADIGQGSSMTRTRVGIGRMDRDRTGPLSSWRLSIRFTVKSDIQAILTSMFRTRASGETDPMSEREKTQRRREHQVSPNKPTTPRGADHRAGEARPKDDPAPRSPA